MTLHQLAMEKRAEVDGEQRRRMGGPLNTAARFSVEHSLATCRIVLNPLPMRVLLRNKKTRLYSTESNGWAAIVGQAFDFTSVPHAARFALDKRLPEIEIVLKCDTLPDEVVMQVIPEYCDFIPLRSAAA